MKNKKYFILIILIILISGCKKTKTKDIYQYQGNAQHTGEFKTEKLPQVNKILWQKDLSELAKVNNINIKITLDSISSITSPVADQSSIYFGIGNCVLSLDHFGNVKWKSNLGDKKLFDAFSTPIIYKNNLIIGTVQGDLLIINKKTGKKFWGIKGDGLLKGKISNNPDITLYGNKLLFSKDKLYCLDLKSRKIKWSQIGAGKPSASKKMVFISDTDNNFLYAYEIENGKLIWKLKNGTDAVIIDDTVFVRTTDVKLYAVDIRNGKIKWKIQFDPYLFDGENSISEIVANEKGIFFYDILNHTVAYNYSGKRLWKSLEAAGGFAPPVITGNRLVEATSNDPKFNYITMSNINNGSLISKIKISGAVWSNMFLTPKGNLILISGDKLLFFDTE